MRARFPISILIALGLTLSAPAVQAAPLWSRVGSAVIDFGLAGLAGGPVTEAAFSLDGSTLYIRTASARIWSTSNDGETWSPVESSLSALDPFSEPPLFDPVAPPPVEDPTALVVQHPFRGGERFALGLNLHRSTDAGETWLNLTGDRIGSVIGPRQSSLAFSPIAPDTIVVGNSLGVWKSTDGGLTWVSLNDNLPNFPDARLLHPPASDRFLGLYAEGFGPLETTGLDGTAWFEATRASRASMPSWLPAEDRERTAPLPLNAPQDLFFSHRVWISGIAVSNDLTTCSTVGCEDSSMHYISSFGGLPGNDILYLGTSDGLVWLSSNGGLSWRRSIIGLPAAGSVVGIYAHPEDSASALAVFSGETGGRVFRTSNGGGFWDDLTADLPDGEVAALAADPATGAVYVAGQFGIFYTIADLTSPSPATAWRSAGELPAEPRDILLDTLTGRLYALLEGWGVYSARAPAVSDALRVLNAADLSGRATAPGGLLTILGEGLQRVGVDGATAPILYSGDDETQIQVPYGARGDSVSLRLTTGTGTHEIGFALAGVSPAIFVDRGNPLILDAGSGRLLSPMYPAVAGSRILILATGLGAVDPEWPAGVPAPGENPPQTVETIKVFLNGISLRVLSSTLAPGYIGTYLIEAEIPAILNAGTGEVQLEAGNAESNRVLIYTQP